MASEGVKLDRQQLLQRVESVSPGLDKKATLDQSDCLIFDKGKIRSYNEQVACSVESLLPDLTCAVKADPLMTMLAKMTEDTVSVHQTDDRLVIQGARKRAKVALETTVRLPEVKQDGLSWQRLPDLFGEAVSLVRHAAAKDKSKFILTCVHIHPEWVEATDAVQVARYTIKTGMTKSHLVKPASIKHVVELGMVEFAETDTWLHFRNDAGLCFSCRRYLDNYPQVSHLFSQGGEEVVLPKGLADTVDKLSVFTKESEEEESARITIKKGRLKIVGSGMFGSYEEVKDVVCDKDLSFIIAPSLLSIVIEKSCECQIAEDNTRLMISKGDYQYITGLMMDE